MAWKSPNSDDFMPGLGRLVHCPQHLDCGKALQSIGRRRQMLAHGAAVLTRSNLDAELADIPALASRSTGDLAGFP